MQTITKDKNWQEQQAFERYALIAPLFDETIDSARRSQLRKELALKAELSERTLSTAMKRLTTKRALPD